MHELVIIRSVLPSLEPSELSDLLFKEKFILLLAVFLRDSVSLPVRAIDGVNNDRQARRRVSRWVSNGQ